MATICPLLAGQALILCTWTVAKGPFTAVSPPGLCNMKAESKLASLCMLLPGPCNSQINRAISAVVWELQDSGWCW